MLESEGCMSRRFFLPASEDWRLLDELDGLLVSAQCFRVYTDKVVISEVLLNKLTEGDAFLTNFDHVAAIEHFVVVLCLRSDWKVNFAGLDEDRQDPDLIEIPILLH